MKFETFEANTEQTRSPSQEANLDQILDYLEEKIATDSCAYLAIEVIAKENNLTSAEIIEIGTDPSSLVFQMAYRLNARMIENFSTTYLFATGFTTLDRIKKYLLSLYQFDVSNIKLRGAIHQYSWSQNKQQEQQINEQAMRLMAPIYLEFLENQIENPDARCHAIWSLYIHALRLRAVKGASAQECLEDIWDSIELICTK